MSVCSINCACSRWLYTASLSTCINAYNLFVRRCLVSLSLTRRMHQCGGLFGPNSAGKSLAIDAFSQAYGRMLVNLTCSEDLNANVLKRYNRVRFWTFPCCCKRAFCVHRLSNPADVSWNFKKSLMGALTEMFTGMMKPADFGQRAKDFFLCLARRVLFDSRNELPIACSEQTANLFLQLPVRGGPVRRVDLLRPRGQAPTDHALPAFALHQADPHRLHHPGRVCESGISCAWRRRDGKAQGKQHCFLHFVTLVFVACYRDDPQTIYS